jgi:hypothetical protein
LQNVPSKNGGVSLNTPDNCNPLSIDLSLEGLQNALDRMKNIIKNGRFGQDWTYARNNFKNRVFRSTYLCDENNYKNIMLKLDESNFYEAEKNNSPKARRDPQAAQEIMYKFILKEEFELIVPENEECMKTINLYIKFTFPMPDDNNVIIISFHEAERSLEEQKNYDIQRSLNNN